MTETESRLEHGQREALGRIRTSLSHRLQTYRETREKAEQTLKNVAQLEAAALEEFAAIDAMLELTNPYRKASARG